MKRWLAVLGVTGVLGTSAGVASAALSSSPSDWGGANQTQGGIVNNFPDVVPVAGSTGAIIGYTSNPLVYDWPASGPVIYRTEQEAEANLPATTADQEP